VLLDHLDVDGVTLLSLQKDPRPADAATLAAHNDRIVDLSASLGDFDDTAAIVAAIDLVISVDTSVVHLAGALARPIWVMLPRTPCWRWLRDRADSPWYPTARLFRQQHPGQWGDTYDEVGLALAAASDPAFRHQAGAPSLSMR
jgi:ADP-heptose:LPS heptosyltransferase